MKVTGPTLALAGVNRATNRGALPQVQQPMPHSTGKADPPLQYPSPEDAPTVVTDASASSYSISSVRRGGVRGFGSAAARGDFHSEPEARRNEPKGVGEISRAGVEKLRVLGSGSFSDVFEVKIVRPHPAGEPGLDLGGTYAAKMLRRRSRRDPPAGSRGGSSSDDATHGRLARAAKDLAEEAALLSRLPRHDNIVALIALSDDFFADPSEGFLLLERLSGTLQDSLEGWRSDAKKPPPAAAFARSRSSGGGCSLFGFSTAKARRKSVARSETLRGTGVGIPLARAMEFLHRNNVIFRDISPSNVGFDEAGTLKLFDFGTARRYAADRAMTEFTGTPRYMSPEVMAGDPASSYGLPADVYSFAVVLWEVSTKTLQKPYALIRDLAAARRSIVEMRYRPPLHQISDGRLRRLIRSGWDPNPRARPAFSGIAAELDRIRSAVATV